MFNLVLLPLVGCAIYGAASLNAASWPILSRLVANPAIRYLGQISYSFFLMQIPLMVFLDQHPSSLSKFSTPTNFVLLLTLTLAAASISYHCVERPGQRLIGRWRQASGEGHSDRLQGVS